MVAVLARLRFEQRGVQPLEPHFERHLQVIRCGSEASSTFPLNLAQFCFFEVAEPKVICCSAKVEGVARWVGNFVDPHHLRSQWLTVFVC